MNSLEPYRDEGGMEAFPWTLGIFDAHCHPTDTMDSIQEIPNMKAGGLTIMSTRREDQELVCQTADGFDHASSGCTGGSQLQECNDKAVVPSFGWHPWFSHQIFDDSKTPINVPLTEVRRIEHYQLALTPQPKDLEFIADLPEPICLSTFIEQTRRRLQKYPQALVGEVGLDKSFRLPQAWLPGQRDQRDQTLTPGGREGRLLSPYRVQQDHQIAVLSAQLRLAGEMQRAVSLHGVQAHGVLFETLRKTWKGHEIEVMSNSERKRRKSVSKAHENDLEGPSPTKIQSDPTFPPRVCLHSYSGPPDFVREYLHPSIPVEFFFSFSIAINFSTAASAKTEQAIKYLPRDRILVESDLHCAGNVMDGFLEEITRKVCTLKGWQLDDGAKQLRKNWEAFVFGRSRHLN